MLLVSAAFEALRYHERKWPIKSGFIEKTPIDMISKFKNELIQVVATNLENTMIIIHHVIMFIYWKRD